MTLGSARSALPAPGITAQGKRGRGGCGWRRGLQQHNGNKEGKGTGCMYREAGCVCWPGSFPEGKKPFLRE